ncbi:proteoglycan 4-like [Leguminivora glycinivorella]|uniref:proteoglycan 4-like n=1 Tax=Leguminivora glycinivorella TaxID=1035111 RepID=UPI0020101056|nr:proteoglycan 4-like [Leguminivora glycinivorella]
MQNNIRNTAARLLAGGDYSEAEPSTPVALAAFLTPVPLKRTLRTRECGDWHQLASTSVAKTLQDRPPMDERKKNVRSRSGGRTPLPPGDEVGSWEDGFLPLPPNYAPGSIAGSDEFDTAEDTAGEAPAPRPAETAETAPEPAPGPASREPEQDKIPLPVPTTRPIFFAHGEQPGDLIDQLHHDTVAVANFMESRPGLSDGLIAWMAAYVRITEHELGFETELLPEDHNFITFLRAHPIPNLRSDKRRRDSPDAPAAPEKRTCRQPTPQANPRDPRLRRRSRSLEGPSLATPQSTHQPTTEPPWRAPSPTSTIGKMGFAGVVLRRLDISGRRHPPTSLMPQSEKEIEEQPDARTLPPTEETTKPPQQPQPEEGTPRGPDPSVPFIDIDLPETQKSTHPPEPLTREAPESRDQPPPPGPTPPDEPKPQRDPARSRPSTRPGTQDPPAASTTATTGPPAKAPTTADNSKDPPIAPAGKGTYADKAAAPSQATTDKKKEQQQAPQPKKEKYPTMSVPVFPNWTKELAAIKEKLGRAANNKPTGRGIIFLPATAEEYRVVYDHLESLGQSIEWHVYQLEKDRQMKVALRGLPSDTPTEEIQAACVEMGYPVVHVKQINAREGRPGCVYFLQLAGPRGTSRRYIR